MAQHTPHREPSGARYGQPNSPPSGSTQGGENNIQEAATAVFASSGADHGSNCPECNGVLRTLEDEAICEDCGLVAADQRIDRGPEWRCLDEGDSEQKSRVGSPQSVAMHDGGLSTTFSISTDGYGSSLSGSKRSRFKRLKKYHKRASVGGKVDRNRISAFVEIKRMISAMGLSKSIRDRACEVFRQAHEEGMLHGSSIENYAAGAVYAACRLMDIPRLLDDVIEYSSSEISGVRQAYFKMNRELGLEVSPPDPKNFVPRIISECGEEFGGKARKEMLSLAKEANEKHISQGRNPAAFAGGIVYYVASDSLTQSEIAETIDVSPATLRNSYFSIQEMVEERDDSEESQVEDGNQTTDVDETDTESISDKRSSTSEKPSSSPVDGPSPAPEPALTSIAGPPALYSASSTAGGGCRPSRICFRSSGTDQQNYARWVSLQEPAYPRPELPNRSKSLMVVLNRRNGLKDFSPLDNHRRTFPPLGTQSLSPDLLPLSGVTARRWRKLGPPRAPPAAGSPPLRSSTMGEQGHGCDGLSLKLGGVTASPLGIPPPSHVYN